MDVLLRKLPFCPELTQILEVEEAHYGKSSNEGIWPWKNSISNARVNSATSEIANLALLTPCTKFEKFCGQISSFEVLWMCHYETFSIMCLSLFQIQNFCQNGDFLKRTSVQHFHFPFLVFSYHVSIIQKQTSECILPSHLGLWAVWAKQHA